MARYLGWGRTVWCVALVSGLLSAQETPKDKAIFEGSVVDSVSRQPIARAAIRLRPLEGDRATYAGDSSAAGKFRFEAMMPGDYTIEVQHHGYTTAFAAALGARRVTGTLTFEAGQTAEGTVWMEPEAVVTGRITDPDGEPAPNVHVIAVEEQWDRGFRVYRQVAYTEADDRGLYRLTVRAGRYFFKAHMSQTEFAEAPGKPSRQIVPVYFPGSPTVETASPAQVVAGAQMSGVDMRLLLARTYHVSGSIRAPNLPDKTVVYLWNRNGDRTPGANFGAVLEKGGVFRIGRILPGQYYLEIPPVRGAPTGKMPVEVTDRDIDLPALGSPEIQLKGRIRLDDDAAGQDVTGVELRLEQVNYYQLPYRSIIRTNKDGEFTLGSVRAGEYVIHQTVVRDLYLKSILYNQRPLAGGHIDLTNGSAGDVELVLGSGTGLVEGTVRWPDAPSAPPQPVLAVLVSANGETADTRAREAEIDGSGHFLFRFVPPGRWLVFVTPGLFNEGLWQNMDFVRQIAGRGVAVEMAKKGSEHVEVPVLTADDLARPLERVRQ